VTRETAGHYLALPQISSCRAGFFLALADAGALVGPLAEIDERVLAE